MKNIISLFMVLTFSIFYAQKKHHKITKDILKLYIKDTLKRKFNEGEYIGVSVYPNKIYVETLNKDFELYKNTKTYQWFRFKEKEIIIFCDFNSDSKCQKYFDRLNFKKIYSEKKILETAPIHDKLDGEIKLWYVFLDDDNRINKISGKIIEVEIANPKDFKKFLIKHSKLSLYQMDEDGEIVYPKPHL